MAAVDYLTYGSADLSFAPYGPYWKFMKKLCMTELLGGRMLDQLLPVRNEEIRKFLQFMTRKANAGETVNVRKQLILLTNNIVSRMLMGQTCSNNEDEAKEIRKLVQATTELTGKFNLSEFVWFCKNLDLQGFRKQLKQVRDKFGQMMEKIIDDHKEARKAKKKGTDDSVKDLLDILLDISEDDSSEMRLTREHIKAFIMDIFAAGTGTSTITIEWALAELINHPNIMEKARKEIDFVVGKSRIVEESDIANLPYLQAAMVKETLRLHPTGPIIVRESSENCTIGGYEIPAKTRLFVNVRAIDRDPTHWDNPLAFCPERLVNQERKSQLDERVQHFHLLPFGSGRRGCPGTSMALQVVQTTLAAAIQCFDWKVEGRNGTVSREGPGLTLPRAHPLSCTPLPRLNSFSSF